VGVVVELYELVEEAGMEIICMANLPAGLDEHRLEEEVGGGMVLGVEEDIELLGEDLFLVGTGFLFCHVNGGDIGVALEELCACTAEGDDVDFELREGFFEGSDEWGEEYRVAELFLGEDGNGVEVASEWGVACPLGREALQGSGKCLA